MRFYRRVWLICLVAGLMFVGAAFASEAADPTPELADEVVMAASDCDDNPGASVSVPAQPNAVLPNGSTADQACWDCHTDQERLQQLAVEEEAAESLSEGPG